MLRIIVCAAALVTGGCTASELPPDVPRHAAAPEAALIEIRRTFEHPAPDRVRIEHDGLVLYAEQQPVLQDADVVSARPAPREGGVVVQLELTPDAAARMEHASGEHIGGRMAIFVDGRLRSTPVVNSAVGSTRPVLFVPADEAEAQQLAEKLQSRWPEGEAR